MGLTFGYLWRTVAQAMPTLKLRTQIISTPGWSDEMGPRSVDFDLNGK